MHGCSMYQPSWTHEVQAPQVLCVAVKQCRFLTASTTACQHAVGGPGENLYKYNQAMVNTSMQLQLLCRNQGTACAQLHGVKSCLDDL
eukprot:222734-Lingulodinium_polyedra.AAC.1